MSPRCERGTATTQESSSAKRRLDDRRVAVHHLRHARVLVPLVVSSLSRIGGGRGNSCCTLAAATGPMQPRPQRGASIRWINLRLRAYTPRSRGSRLAKLISAHRNPEHLTATRSGRCHQPQIHREVRDRGAHRLAGRRFAAGRHLYMIYMKREMRLGFVPRPPTDSQVSVSRIRTKGIFNADRSARFT